MNRCLMLLATLGLAACSSSNDDLKDWMKETKKNAEIRFTQGRPEQFTLPPRPSYNPPNGSPKNIFSRRVFGHSGGNGPDLSRPREILEKFSLENLVYVGYLKGATEPTSYLLDKSSAVASPTLYPAQVGNYVGQNYGKIVSIEPDKILVMEKIKDDSGAWVDRSATIKLRAIDKATGSTK